MVSQEPMLFARDFFSWCGSYASLTTFWLSTVKPQWLKHWCFVYHGLFELVFASHENSSVGSGKQIFRVVRHNFLFYHENICCTHYNRPIEAILTSTLNKPLYYRRSNIQIYPHLPPDPALWLPLNGSNYPCLEQISMVPKLFESLKFFCTLNSFSPVEASL